MSSRLGPKQDYDYDKTDQIWEWVNNSNVGVMGFDGTIPIECLEFCVEQYNRFGVPVHPDMYDVIRIGAGSAFYHCECNDPYALFWEVSDVNITNEWSMYTYEIRDGDRRFEADPECFETFRYVPGQCEEVFDHIMSHPGLAALPGCVGSELSDILRGEYSDEPAVGNTHGADLEVLRKMCTINGVEDWTRINAYYDLAAWAGFAWLAGPPGRIYRMDRHDVIGVAISYGESILLDGCVMDPQFYKKLSRPPISCHVCGVSAWCTELTMTEGFTRHICEHCNSEGMPPIHMATCGGKRCLLSECLHHPYHNHGTAGIRNAMRDFGQLRSVADGQTVTRVAGSKVLQLKG